MKMMQKLLMVFGLQLLLFSGIGAASRRASKEESLIGLTVEKYVIGTWQPYLKTVNKCLNFRLNTTPPLFVIWPEDEFTFCCEDRKTPQTIASYVHSEFNGRFLHPIAYYDVGIVNRFMPFWLFSWRPDRVSQTDITQLAYCEMNDLKRFYVHRFWHEAIGKQGLLYSGFLFIFVVEFLVFLATIFQYIRWPSTPIWKTFKRFWGWESFWDLVHLCLLGVNGNLLMEAVGHWDPCGWEAVVLYNCGVFYTYLTLLSIVSAVVQQIALWTAVTTSDRLKANSVDLEGRSRAKKYKIEKEWQLQRISLQCAVFYVASLYCVFVTVYTRDEFVAWLLGIIIVAQVWSCVVAFGLLFKAFKLGCKCYDDVLLARERQKETTRADSRDHLFNRSYFS